MVLGISYIQDYTVVAISAFEGPAFSAFHSPDVDCETRARTLAAFFACD